MSTIETRNVDTPNVRHSDTCKAGWNGGTDVLAASGMIAAQSRRRA